MNLFSNISDRTLRLIDQNHEIVESNIEAWIKMEKKLRAGISVNVLQYLAISKRRFNHSQSELKKTPKRNSLITSLIRMGYDFSDIKITIDHMVNKWINNPQMKDNLTPETLFTISNFPKYHEEATSNLSNHVERPGTIKGSKNQYEDLLNG